MYEDYVVKEPVHMSKTGLLSGNIMHIVPGGDEQSTVAALGCFTCIIIFCCTTCI